MAGLVGDSVVMRRVRERLERIAARDSPLVIEGESGTGKGLAAEAVHAASARRAGPFVVVDCGEMAPALLETELIGQPAGNAGAAPREGAFVGADGGTLFLDDVGILDVKVQSRLLGIIDQRPGCPPGGRSSRRLDVRIIAAANRELRAEVTAGKFRADLYYRLAVTCVRMPTLRERPEDIPQLCRHVLTELRARDGIEYSLSTEQIRRLCEGRWPGNVRELMNAIERLATLDIEDWDALGEGATGLGGGPSSKPVTFHDAKAEVVATFERGYLRRVLDEHAGNITASAQAAGVDRVHFLRLLDRYGFRKPPSRS